MNGQDPGVSLPPGQCTARDHGQADRRGLVAQDNVPAISRLQLCRELRQWWDRAGLILDQAPDRKITDFRACIGVPEGILGLVRK
jgi:hypothetical protein